MRQRRQGGRDAWRGETTAEMTGGVTIETKKAPLISLETSSQESSTGSETEWTVSIHTHIHVFISTVQHQNTFFLCYDK